MVLLLLFNDQEPRSAGLSLHGHVVHAVSAFQKLNVVQKFGNQA